MTSRRCTAVRADGAPCRAWAMHDTDPPRCAVHGGTTRRIGAPEGNRNALKHGYYADRQLPGDCTIDAVIDVLYQRQLQLEDYIDAIWHQDIPIRELTHLLRIHGQNASRLGRLLRDRRALSGDAADGISGAIAQALDELGSEMGVEL